MDICQFSVRVRSQFPATISTCYKKSKSHLSPRMIPFFSTKPFFLSFNKVYRVLDVKHLSLSLSFYFTLPLPKVLI